MTDLRKNLLATAFAFAVFILYIFGLLEVFASASKETFLNSYYSKSLWIFDGSTCNHGLDVGPPLFGRETIVTDALLRKLGSFCPLNREDAALIADIADRPRIVAAHEDIIHEGDVPRDVRLITSGFAIRYKLLPNGSRQILAYLLPGDFCDLHIFILDEMDHGIAALSACTVVDIPRNAILRLTERPAIARALWWATLVDESTLREALVNMGRRQAEERVGHFLCELLMRLEVVGLVSEDSFNLPLTQRELADTMGLSTVHINRVLQQLRGNRLITFDAKRLVVLDVEGLKRFSGFNPNYLHLGKYKSSSDSTDKDVATNRVIEHRAVTLPPPDLGVAAPLIGA